MELKLKRIKFSVGTTTPAKLEIEDIIVFKETPSYYFYMLGMDKDEPVEKRLKKSNINTDRYEGRFNATYLISMLYICHPEAVETIKKRILDDVTKKIEHLVNQSKLIEHNFKQFKP